MNVERLPVRHHERVAVLLNANAGAVTDRLRRELENFVPPEDIFYSRTLEDARGIARTVLERGYATVLTGGGDGTFVAYVNCLFGEAAAEAGSATCSRSSGAPSPATSCSVESRRSRW